jgi:hypothetical protein
MVPGCCPPERVECERHDKPDDGEGHDHSSVPGRVERVPHGQSVTPKLRKREAVRRRSFRKRQENGVSGRYADGTSSHWIFRGSLSERY